MELQIIWTIILFAAAWGLSWLLHACKEDSIYDHGGFALAMGVFVLSAFTVSMSWDFIAQPMINAIDRFVPDPSTDLHGFTVFVLAALAGCAYLAGMFAIPSIVRLRLARLLARRPASVTIA